jgi:DeoR family galactitol utilization operon repressor
LNEELIERERTILNILSERGSLSVTLLSRELKVSEVTIRSDLKGLEERGYLNRSRGGAYPAFHSNIIERRRRTASRGQPPCLSVTETGS